MTIAERREKARLRSERWRQAHVHHAETALRNGHGLRKGVSRSTWYRRRKKVREQAAAAQAAR